MSQLEPESFHIELDLHAYPEPPSRPVAEEPAPSLGTRLRILPEASQILSSANRFALDPERATALYNADPETMGGRIIGGDDLVRVMPWTRENPLLSYRFGGEAVASLPLRMFRKRMALPISSSDECVLLTMGMPACGKTTLVKAGMGQWFHTVVDSPLASADTARELRQIARESGRKVAFLFAHRSLASAVRGMLERALPWREGRTVSLEHMGNILVKGLALFLELADSNTSDDETTLDMVEVIEGRRQWHCGPAAAARVAEIRADLLYGGTSILEELACQWIEALRDAQRLGWRVPELLVELVQEDLDPRMLAVAAAPRSSRKATSRSAGSSVPFKVRSLLDITELRANLPRWAEQADIHEASLRLWRAAGEG